MIEPLPLLAAAALPLAAVRSFDLDAARSLYGGEHGALGVVMVAFTLLGSGWSAAALLPMAASARTRRFAAALAGSLAVQAVLVWSAKLVVGRVRPWIALGLPPPLGSPHDPSFPSGHAAGSFCVAAFVVVAAPALWPDRPRLRAAIGAVVVAAAALVALSRVYLGAHFVTDVVAGASLGAAVGAIGGGLYRARAPTRSPLG